MKRVIWLVCMVLVTTLLGCGGGGGGAPASGTLKVVNDYTSDLSALYVAPTSSNTWGTSMLNSTVATGSSVSGIPLAPGTYDICYVFANGHIYFSPNTLTIAAGSSVTRTVIAVSGTNGDASSVNTTTNQFVGYWTTPFLLSDGESGTLVIKIASDGTVTGSLTFITNPTTGQSSQYSVSGSCSTSGSLSLSYLVSGATRNITGTLAQSGSNLTYQVLNVTNPAGQQLSSAAGTAMPYNAVQASANPFAGNWYRVTYYTLNTPSPGEEYVMGITISNSGSITGSLYDDVENKTYSLAGSCDNNGNISITYLSSAGSGTGSFTGTVSKSGANLAFSATHITPEGMTTHTGSTDTFKPFSTPTVVTSGTWKGVMNLTSGTGSNGGTATVVVSQAGTGFLTGNTTNTDGSAWLLTGAVSGSSVEAYLYDSAIACVEHVTGTITGSSMAINTSTTSDCSFTATWTGTLTKQ